MSLLDQINRRSVEWDSNLKRNLCGLCSMSLDKTQRIITYNNGLSMHQTCSEIYDELIAKSQFKKDLK